MSAQRVDRIPEVISEIIGWTDWRTTTTCARVSQVWNEIAVEQIWRYLDSLEPLIRVTGELREVAESLTFEQPPSPERIERFRYYAAKVRTLYHTDGIIEPNEPITRMVFSDEVFGILQSALPVGEKILPKVESIVRKVVYSRATLSQAVLLVTPRIKYLELLCDVPSNTVAPQAIRSLNDAISATGPLENFICNLMETMSDPVVSRNLLGFIEAHPNLKQFAFPFFHTAESEQRLLSAVQKMPSVETLGLSIYIRETEVTLKPFIQNLVSSVPKIQSLSLAIFYPPSDFGPLPFQHMFAPLLSLSELWYLELDCWQGLVEMDDPTVLKLMNKSWPRLKVLRLCGEHSDVRGWLLPIRVLNLFSTHFPNLEELALPLSGDADFLELPRQASWTTFRRLERLDLGKFSVVRREQLRGVTTFLAALIPWDADIVWGPTPMMQVRVDFRDGMCLWREVVDMVEALWEERRRCYSFLDRYDI